MLPFGVTIPATVPQGSEIPEGLMNNPVYKVSCYGCGSVRRRAEVIQLTDLILQLEDVQNGAAACAQKHVESHSVDCTEVSLLPR